MDLLIWNTFVFPDIYLCNPLYNSSKNKFDDVDAIDGKRLESNVVRKQGCRKCPVRCKAELIFDSGRFKGQKATRPEFEPMLSLGAKCGLNDLNTLVYLDNLCSDMGIDSVSTGTTNANNDYSWFEFFRHGLFPISLIMRTKRPVQE